MLAFPLDSNALVWWFTAIQITCFLTAWLARLSEGAACQVWIQRLFLVCLVANGIATIGAPQIGAGYWLISAANLGGTILIAVWDFRHRDRAFGI